MMGLDDEGNETKEKGGAVTKESTITIKKNKHKEQQNRPDGSDFWQQSMTAWRPIVTVKSTTRTLFIIGIVFIIFGAVVLQASINVIEIGVQYQGPPLETARGSDWYSVECEGTCTVTLTAPDKGMEGPINVYYELDNFHQNYLSYSTSKDNWQLRGDDVETTGCDLFDVYDENRTYLPCGLQAHSMFNDTFTLETEGYVVNETGIAWTSDRNRRFGNPENYPDMCGEGGDSFCLYEQFPEIENLEEEGMNNEHFIVWMRLAALPRFRKLYGRIDGDLAPNETLSFEIVNNFPVDSFGGSKGLVLSTSSWIGGKNLFLGLAFIMLGLFDVAVCLMIGCKQFFCPRSDGSESDMRASNSRALGDNSLNANLLPHDASYSV